MKHLRLWLVPWLSATLLSALALAAYLYGLSALEHTPGNLDLLVIALWVILLGILFRGPAAQVPIGRRTNALVLGALVALAGWYFVASQPSQLACQSIVERPPMSVTQPVLILGGASLERFIVVTASCPRVAAADLSQILFEPGSYVAVSASAASPAGSAYPAPYPGPYPAPAPRTNSAPSQMVGVAAAWVLIGGVLLSSAAAIWQMGCWPRVYAVVRALLQIRVHIRELRQSGITRARLRVMSGALIDRMLATVSQPYWVTVHSVLLSAALLIMMLALGGTLILEWGGLMPPFKAIKDARFPLDRPTAIYSIYYDTGDSRLYIGTNRGWYESPDGGRTWQAPTMSSRASRGVEMLTHIDSSIYAFATFRGAPCLGSRFGVHCLDRALADTTDGSVWRRLGRQTNVPIVQAFLIDEQRQLFLIGTRDGIFQLDQPGDIFWKLSDGFPGHDVRVLVQGAEPEIVVAGTAEGLYRSTDSGRTWSSPVEGPPPIPVLALVRLAGQRTLLAGTSVGLFRSDDDGKRWVVVEGGLPQVGVSAIAQGGSAGILLVGTQRGVYRTGDGGATWAITSLRDTPVISLAETSSATRYAGTAAGELFRSDDGGETWGRVPLGITHHDIRALAVSGDDEALFVGTFGDGIFQTDLEGERWASRSDGLGNLHVMAILLDRHGQPAYAATYGGGVYRWNSAGERWEAMSSGLPDLSVLALDSLGDSGALIAGTQDAGVYRWEPTAQVWTSMNAGLKGTEQIRAFAGGAGEPLFACAYDQGVLQWDEVQHQWRSLSRASGPNTVMDITYDSRGHALYAATPGNTVWAYDTHAGTWRSILMSSLGASAQTIERSPDGHILVGTSQGLQELSGFEWRAQGLRIPDGAFVQTIAFSRQQVLVGTTRDVLSFRGANALSRLGGWPADYKIRELRADAERIDAYVEGSQSAQSILPIDAESVPVVSIGAPSLIYRSLDEGKTWSEVPDAAPPVTVNESLVITSTFAGWRVQRNDLPWSRPLGYNEVPLASVAAEDSGRGEIVAYAVDTNGFLWATRIDYPLARLAEPLRTPLNMLIRLLFSGGVTRGGVIGGSLGFAFLFLALLLTYMNQAYPFGISPWRYLVYSASLGNNRLDTYAKPDLLERSWPSWKRAIRELLMVGEETTPRRLGQIPNGFEEYAVERYWLEHREQQMLERDGVRLRFRVGQRLAKWQASWQGLARSLQRAQRAELHDRREVQELAQILAEVLGLTLVERRDFAATSVYMVEAPALKLNVPVRFPVVFVADPRPGDRTVEMIADAVAVLREAESQYFAMVIPLEPADRSTDSATLLRQAFLRSAYARDYVVLSQERLLDLLVATDPLQVIARPIQEQADLSVVTPFVIRGPVPNRVFFGRQAEARLLVERSSISDYAIVGNRKIGKTSLLQRVERDLRQAGHSQIIAVNCQTVRTAQDFYLAFQDQLGDGVGEPPPVGFVGAIERMRDPTRPTILLLDEVDALLTHERRSGEELTARWRQLSQAGACHFIFCGSTGLVQSLRDARSVFFNFAQPMPLGYLDEDAARSVLFQPLTGIGIELREPDHVWEQVFAMTSGHPNLIQFIGYSLVELVNDRQERVVLPDDIAKLWRASGFVDFFFETVWGAASPLEKLITLVAPEGEFTTAEIERALESCQVRVDPDLVDDALRMLEVYAILGRRDRAYRFIPQAFPRLLHATQEVERLISRERRQHEQGEGDGSAGEGFAP